MLLWYSLFMYPSFYPSDFQQTFVTNEWLWRKTKRLPFPSPQSFVCLVFFHILFKMFSKENSCHLPYQLILYFNFNILKIQLVWVLYRYLAISNLVNSILYLHSLHPWSTLIIPLKRRQTVAIQFSKGVDNMGTEVGVHVFGIEFAKTISVLWPVCIVTYPPICKSCNTYMLVVLSFSTSGY